jgi:hypothetical protein
VPREALVTVVRGPASGRRLKLKGGATAIIGRAKDVELSIDDPGISARHVRLEHVEGGVLVKDLARKGAVTIDARPLDRGSELLVSVEVKLGIAGSELRIFPAQGKVRTPQRKAPDGYRYLHRLGVGQSEVWAAVHEASGREVAIKEVGGAEDGEPVLRARREFELQRLLDHPSIARVEALVEARGRLHLVAERLRGKTLRDALASGPLTPARAGAIGAQVASALAHAHERGVIHRDVAPANVFIVENEPLLVKLADFGLAVPVDRHTTIVEQHLTETGEGMGTPRYDAPEMLFSAKEAGPPADVYALGAVLYHALAGRTPFGDRSDDEWLAVVRKTKPRSVREAAPGTPEKLATLVMRMLEPRPARRPTASEVAAALSRRRS